MRLLILLGFLTVTIVSILGARPGVAADERWCAIYNGLGGGGINCGFYTLQQCRDTISGIGGTCGFDYRYQQEMYKYGHTPKRYRHKRG